MAHPVAVNYVMFNAGADPLEFLIRAEK